MSFRERLREQIEYCGFLDKEVADKAGITKRAIDSYVGARACIPSAEIAVRLAKVLNCSVEYLVTGEEINTIKNDKHHGDVIKLIKKIQKLDEEDIQTVSKFTDYLLSQKK